MSAKLATAIAAFVMCIALADAAANADEHRRLRPTALPTGVQPSSVVAALLDKDRHLDLAVANQGSDSISIFRGRGDGTFHKASTLTTGPGPRSIQAADVNEDGRMDLLTADSESNTVSVLLATRHGTFRPRVAIPVGDAAANPIAILTADLNQDGHLDLAVAYAGANVIGVLLGAGDGTFPTRIDNAGFVRDDPQALVAGDFNDDGRMDLATANFDFVSVSTLAGAGNGTFTTGPEYFTGSVSFALTAADMNDDGRLDLVIANYARTDFPFGRNSVTVLLGDGTGHFTILPETPLPARPVAVVSADFNHDGHEDVAVASFDSRVVSVLFGTGAGTFSRITTLRTAAGPTALATGDFDRNRSVDLAVVNETAQSVQVFLSNARRR